MFAGADCYAVKYWGRRFYLRNKCFILKREELSKEIIKRIREDYKMSDVIRLISASGSDFEK